MMGNLHGTDETSRGDSRSLHTTLQSTLRGLLAGSRSDNGGEVAKTVITASIITSPGGGQTVIPAKDFPPWHYRSIEFAYAFGSYDRISSNHPLATQG